MHGFMFCVYVCMTSRMCVGLHEFMYEQSMYV